MTKFDLIQLVGYNTIKACEIIFNGIENNEDKARLGKIVAKYIQTCKNIMDSENNQREIEMMQDEIIELLMKVEVKNLQQYDLSEILTDDGFY